MLTAVQAKSFCANRAGAVLRSDAAQALRCRANQADEAPRSETAICSPARLHKEHRKSSPAVVDGGPAPFSSCFASAPPCCRMPRRKLGAGRIPVSAANKNVTSRSDENAINHEHTGMAAVCAVALLCNDRAVDAKDRGLQSGAYRWARAFVVLQAEVGLFYRGLHTVRART